MVREHGTRVLLGGNAGMYVMDYKGSFDIEADIFISLLKAGCA